MLEYGTTSLIFFFQAFEGSIVGENFSLSDPSSNNPLVHGGLDRGGGLVSFHKVSDKGKKTKG